MSVERTRETMTAFMKDLAEHGPYDRHLAADVTFAIMSTGQEIEGRAAVEGFIRLFHERAFTARTQIKVALINDGRALLEMDLVGTHTGSFRGVAATGREINVPCSIAFDLCDGEITAMRGYLPIDRLMQQISAEPPEDAGTPRRAKGARRG